MNTSKQINVMVALIFLSLIAFGAYTIWDPVRADEAATLQEEKAAERGAHTFAQNCRLCHGDRGEGGAAGGRMPQAVPLDRPDLQGRPGPGEPVDAVALKTAQNLIKNTITCGRVGTAMPTWGDSQGGPLNDEQIRQLTVLITTGGWDLVEEFAAEIDATHIHLTKDVTAADTELLLESTAGFQVGNPMRIDRERVLIKEVLGPTLVVDRGGGGTEAAQHAAGAKIGTTGAQLRRSLSPTETELLVDSVAGFQIGSTITVDREQMVIRDVKDRQPTLVVERGVLATDAAEHAAGAEVFNQPAPIQNPAILQAACGQRLLAPVPTPAQPAPTAGPGTVLPTPQPTATPTPPAPGVQEVTITAKVGIKFDLEEIRVKPGPVLIHFVNEDTGVPHNFAVYTDKSLSEDIAGKNENICTGPCNADISFEAPKPGKYFFQCDVHPQIMVGDFIVEE